MQCSTTPAEAGEVRRVDMREDGMQNLVAEIQQRTHCGGDDVGEAACYSLSSTDQSVQVMDVVARWTMDDHGRPCRT